MCIRDRPALVFREQHGGGGQFAGLPFAEDVERALGLLLFVIGERKDVQIVGVVPLADAHLVHPAGALADEAEHLGGFFGAAGA